MGTAKLMATVALSALLAWLPASGAWADDAGQNSAGQNAVDQNNAGSAGQNGATQEQRATPPPAQNGCPFRNNKLDLIA